MAQHKLSMRVTAVATMNVTHTAGRVGVYIHMKALKLSWIDPHDDYTALDKDGPLADAPTYSLVHFQEGTIGIKLTDTWVFVIGNIYGHGSAHFIGFRKFPSKIECVW